MPEKETKRRALADKRAGKSASTQAGEYVREEIHHVREGKHGARSTKQAIAIGLAKARREGVALPPSKTASKSTRRKAASDNAAGRRPKRSTSRTRSRAMHRALEKEGSAAGTHRALSRHARSAAKKRTAGERSAAARKAAKTKGPAERSTAAKKAARTRAAHER